MSTSAEALTQPPAGYGGEMAGVGSSNFAQVAGNYALVTGDHPVMPDGTLPEQRPHTAESIAGVVGGVVLADALARGMSGSEAMRESEKASQLSWLFNRDAAAETLQVIGASVEQVRQEGFGPLGADYNAYAGYQDQISRAMDLTQNNMSSPSSENERDRKKRKKKADGSSHRDDRPGFALAA